MRPEIRPHSRSSIWFNGTKPILDGRKLTFNSTRKHCNCLLIQSDKGIAGEKMGLKSPSVDERRTKCPSKSASTFE